jgi:hypothetical protein
VLRGEDFSLVDGPWSIDHGSEAKQRFLNREGRKARQENFKDLRVLRVLRGKNF